MTEQGKDINIIELLMGIKEDVSSIKTDIANFKESQKVEKDTLRKEIDDVRSDCLRELHDLETKVMGRINTLQNVQSNLVGDVDTLKNADTAKDAKKYRTVLAYVGTAIGSMLVVKLPEIIRTLYMIVINNGGN